MTVRKKCRQGHFFDLTEDMLIPFKNGKGVRTSCPECGVSVILSWKDVAELLGTDIDGAKQYISGQPVPLPIEKQIKKYVEPPIIDLSTSDFDPSPMDFSLSESDPNEDETQETEDLIKAIEKYEKEHKMSDVVEEDVEEKPVSGLSVKRTSLDDELEKSSDDILRDVIMTSDLPEKAKDEITDYLSYKQNVQPNELQSALELYGVAPNMSKKIANRYYFCLTSWAEKKNRANQLNSMMGPIGNVQIPNYNPPFGMPAQGQSPLPGKTPGNQENPVQGNQSTILWMIQSYQMNPQGFIMWLQSNPNYLPLWQQAQLQMQLMNPQMQYGFGSPMNPMQNPMMMQGGYNQSRNGASREEIRRMITDETGKQIDGLKQYLNQVVNPRNNDNSVVMPILLKLIEERNHQVPPSQDPNATMMSNLVQSLLNHTLENSRGDPAMGAVIEELKELKKEYTSGGSGTSRTIEEFQKMIEAMRLQSQIELDKKKFDQETLSSERNRELIKDTINSVVPAIGQVVATMAQRGGSIPPQQVQGTYTENTTSLECPACGTPIVFPKGSKTVKCPSCGSQYSVEVDSSVPPPDNDVPPFDSSSQIESPSIEVTVPTERDSERQNSEDEEYPFRKEGVF